MGALKIDYHFHPNLPKSDRLALRRCRSIWKKFEEEGIRCVLVTEHSYKNPRRAYEFMKDTMPDGFFCFPGVECVSKENVDLIVFSRNEEIYKYEELNSFALDYESLISFVMGREDLVSFVPHPYLPSWSAIIRSLGKASYRKLVDKLGAVEISNGSLDGVMSLLNIFVFKKIFAGILRKFERLSCLPEEDYPRDIGFLAAGSDAHHVWNIGNCYNIECEEEMSVEAVFELVCSNSGRGEVFLKKKKMNIWYLLRNGGTALNEFFIKLLLRVGMR